MTRLVLDAGAFVALERGDVAMWERMRVAKREGITPRTHGGILGQVWRGGARQALLARVLGAIETAPQDAALGRRAGELLATTGGKDVHDAAVVLLASDGDQIATSDVDDILLLVEARGLEVEVVHV